jgi:hypothetical protein
MLLGLLREEVCIGGGGAAEVAGGPLKPDGRALSGNRG